MRVVISVSLDPVRDADLLRWLHAQGDRERSAIVRQALRAQMQDGPTLSTVLDAIRGLEGKIGRLQAPSRNSEPEEPSEAAQALDELGR